MRFFSRHIKTSWVKVHDSNFLINDMNIKKVKFTNKEGQNLVGKLELPTHIAAHNFAIFAHCFTCNKNLAAVRHITRSLTANGFGVLRFDFTGLGESEGDFADTNFSGNVEDLIVAADFLKENYSAPSLIIGHSLGGSAVLYAADKISSIKAVATIGAPSEPEHVTKLLKCSLEEIETNGKAIVNLSGRDFTIKKQFVDDLRSNSLIETVKNLRKPVLFLHSPQDDTVSIKNAEKLYHAALHPKSFVSLDGADHLLVNKEDSLYVGQVISGWSLRYIDIPKSEAPNTSHQVAASLNKEDGFTTAMKVGSHGMLADEPTSVGGNDFGPAPYEYVSGGLAACTVMTVQMYAKRKDWPLENVEIHISHDKIVNEDGQPTDRFLRHLKLEGQLEEKQKQRLLQIADKCPVHKTLSKGSIIETILL